MTEAPMPTSASASFHIRPARTEDLPGMARVHVETWKTTYRGIVPDERLDQMTVAWDLERGFGKWAVAPPPGVCSFVALSGPKDIVGFAVGEPNREPDEEFPAELVAIYVLRGYQGRGIGRALVGEVAGFHHAQGREAMLVWVLAANPYRRFYGRLGGRVVRERTAPVAGVPLAEVGFGWSDLRPLLSLRVPPSTDRRRA